MLYRIRLVYTNVVVIILLITMLNVHIICGKRAPSLVSSPPMLLSSFTIFVTDYCGSFTSIFYNIRDDYCETTIVEASPV